MAKLPPETAKLFEPRLVAFVGILLGRSARIKVTEQEDNYH
jgi:hypothetical protein